MTHGEDGELAGAWLRDRHEPARPTQGEARLVRFDATQDVLLAAGAMNRAPPSVPLALAPAEHDAQAERLAEACRRYLAAHAQVKATP